MEHSLTGKRLVYIIKTPSNTWRAYGSPYIVHQRLNLQISLKDYLSAPYITITILSDNIKPFLWFWAYLNGGETDQRWKDLSLDEKLDVWQYLKETRSTDDILKWYYDNVLLGAESLLERDIFQTLSSFSDDPKIKVAYSFTRTVSRRRDTINDILLTLSSFAVDPKTRMISSFIRTIAKINNIDVGWYLSLKNVANTEGNTFRSAIFDGIRYFKVGDKGEVITRNMQRIFGYDEYVAISGGKFKVMDDNDEKKEEYKHVEFYSNLYERKESSPILGREIREEMYNYHFLHGPILFPIRVGELTLHGDLLTMRQRSRLIDSTLTIAEGDLFTIKPSDSTFSLLSGERIRGDLRSLLYVWAYLNGIDVGKDIGIRAWHYINYFEIPLDSPFVENYLTLLIENIRTLEQYYDVAKIIASIPSSILKKYKIMEDDRSGHLIADEILRKHLSTPVTLRPEYKDYKLVSPGDMSSEDYLIIWDSDNIEIKPINVGEDGLVVRDHRDDPNIREKSGVLIMSDKDDGTVHDTLISCIRPPRLRFKLNVKNVPSDWSGITEVIFKISTDAKHSLKFDKPVDTATAIMRVEDYLSEPTTEEYYRVVEPEGRLWAIVRNAYPLRGNLVRHRKSFGLHDHGKGVIEFL